MTTKFLKIAGLLIMTCVSIGVVSAADDDAKQKKEALRAFQKAWATDVNLDKVLAVDLLPDDYKKAVEHYFDVMQDPYWSTRLSVFKKFTSIKSEDAREELNKLFDKEKSEDVKANVVVALSVERPPKAENWELIRNVAVDPKEDFKVRVAALRVMAEKMPQKFMKQNFEAYFTILREELDDNRKADKDEELRLIKWLTVYGMERLSSEEFGDNVLKWEVWWETAKDEPIPYRTDKKINQKIEGVKVEGNTFARKNTKRKTNLELLLLPTNGYTSNIYQPYLYEFTQYFKLSSWEIPNAYDIADKKMEQAGQPAYIYPIAKVANIFEERRKKTGGTVGILASGSMPNFIAMEYAKHNPEAVMFCVCVSPTSSFRDFGLAVQRAKSANKDPVIQTHAKFNVYPTPPMTEQEAFDRYTGSIRALFSDTQDIEQHYVAQRCRSQEQNTGVTSVLDPEYKFEGQGITVPMLFITGADDPWAVDSTQKELSKIFLNSTFATMRNTSRTPWLEDPIAFFDIVDDFLEKNNIWEKIEELEETANEEQDQEEQPDANAVEKPGKKKAKSNKSGSRSSQESVSTN